MATVESTGIFLALMDISAEHTVDYNRWYDLDHLPEHSAKADVLLGRRYVATRELREAPGVLRSALLGGYPSYLTTYWYGGPLDQDSDEAVDGWRMLDRRLLKTGRFWRFGQVRHAARWRWAAAVARPGCQVRAAAVPYLAHRGVIVALGRAASPDRLADAAGWWDQVHLPDLITVPGVLSAVRFDRFTGMASAPESGDDLVLHLLFCEDHPAEVITRIEQARRYWRAVGRYPAHGGAYEDLAFLPYARIVPLEYDFDLGEPNEPETAVVAPD